jgi:phosphoribosylformylglycinamidine synthase
MYERPFEEPKWQREVQKLEVDSIPIPKDLDEVLMKLMASPNLCCKSWVWEQYDHMVMTNTLALPGSDAAVLRIKDTKKAIAISIDCNSRACYLNPYAGAMLAVCEAARNVSASGAKPLAITNCLNFGNPEKPEIMWQFKQTISGLIDACTRLGTPVTGGNVSFYNETKGEAIYPTPTIGMVGIMENFDLRCTQWWKDAGDIIMLLGKNYLDFGGSEYLYVVHGKVAGMPSLLDFNREIASQDACRTGITRGLVKSAHDVSDGGLAVALAECSLGRPFGMLGSTVKIESELRPDALLFGESASRILISVAPENVEKMLVIAKELRAPVSVIGEVGGGGLRINDFISVDLSRLHRAWNSSMAKLAGE